MGFNDASMRAKCVAEFMGTFMLVFTVGCNVLGKTPVWAGVSIASVLMVLIYSMGKVSGANFNPAVSLSLGISKSMGGPGHDWKTVAIYCSVQIVAGIVAAFCYAMLFWNAFNLGPSKGFGALSAGLCEIFYTFMLCFVVLNVAAASAVDDNHYFGLAIGFVIIAGAYGAGVVSGGCFNPAVAIGIDVSSAGLGFGWCIAYTIFEFIGAALAAVAFKYVRPSEFGHFLNSQHHADLIAEFLGTFMLVLTVGLNVLGNSPAGAFSIAAALMCMIYALGDVSGAHFNPAVTLCIFASKLDNGLSGKKAGMYVLVQVAGGILAAIMYSFIYFGHSFQLGPQPGYGWNQAACAEIVFTFVLCYVVLCTAVCSESKSTTMFGLAIGSCVTVGGFAIGGISGGSLNPAVSISVASSHLMHGGIIAALMYSIFECTGAIIAVGVFKATHGQLQAEGAKTVAFQIGLTP